MCRNWKLWAGVAVVAVGIAVLAGGGLGAALPLLLVAACPVGMALMGLVGLGMATRGGRGDDDDGARRAEEIRQLRAEVARLRDETQTSSPPVTGR